MPLIYHKCGEQISFRERVDLHLLQDIGSVGADVGAEKPVGKVVYGGSRRWLC